MSFSPHSRSNGLPTVLENPCTRRRFQACVYARFQVKRELKVTGETRTVICFESERRSELISETRESRDQALLLRELISTLIGTAVLIGVIALVLFLRRALCRRLGRLTERAAAVTSVGGTQVVTTERLLPFANRAVTVVAS